MMIVVMRLMARMVFLVVDVFLMANVLFGTAAIPGFLRGSNAVAGEAADPFVQARRTMVEDQIRARGIRDERVLRAMLTVPRHHFVDARYRSQAYGDHPLPESVPVRVWIEHCKRRRCQTCPAGVACGCAPRGARALLGLARFSQGRLVGVGVGVGAGHLAGS
jgi:hypothetical protein